MLSLVRSGEGAEGRRGGRTTTGASLGSAVDAAMSAGDNRSLGWTILVAVSAAFFYWSFWVLVLPIVDDDSPLQGMHLSRPRLHPKCCACLHACDPAIKSARILCP